MPAPVPGLGSFANLNRVMTGGTSGIGPTPATKFSSTPSFSKTIGGGVPKLSASFSKAIKSAGTGAKAPKGLSVPKMGGKVSVKGLLGTSMSAPKGLSMPKL